MQLSIAIQGLCGLTWPAWKRLVQAVEPGGFAGLFCTDHFVLPGAATVDSLEAMVALTYLADHTRQIHFGPLVAPFSFRDPVMLARQAAVLDDLSGGRMCLGVGAGWMEYEHQMFGYQLGDLAMRMARFAEGLEVVTSLLRSTAPVSYSGRFYQLHEAVLHPHIQRPGGVPILVGGKGPRRTLPLIARYADIWNATRLTPAEFRARSEQLDHIVHAAGRDPRTIKRTVMVPVLCGRNTNELEQRVASLRQLFPEWRELPLDALLDAMRDTFGAMIVGTPAEVVQAMRAYSDVGVAELIMQWFGVEDLDGLQLLADQVVPQLA
jgi:alkanesulfonate monooxygenase SsuD/methylene tetrahydromethanopterin reductase-like flavin-dependent oxidoreductase (luciferase family)